MGQQRFQTLDAMRGIAALTVLSLHICKLLGGASVPPQAHLAVDFFFLLSGLVIAQAYEDRLLGGWSLWAFLQKRVVRLYPMVFVGGVLGLGVLVSRQLLNKDLGWTNIGIVVVTNFLLLPNNAVYNFRWFSFVLNSPYWSLSCEFLVNLTYAAVVVHFNKAWLALLLLLSGGALLAVSIMHQGVDVGFFWNDYGIGVVRSVFPFFVGVAIHRFVRLRPQHTAFDLPAIAILVLLLLSPLSPAGAWEWLTIAVIFPALVILGASAVPIKRLEPIWEELGQLSFPIYAIHYPIVVIFSQAVKSTHLSGLGVMEASAACAAIVVIAAHVILTIWDLPARAWLDRAVRTRSRPKLATRPRASDLPLA